MPLILVFFLVITAGHEHSHNGVEDDDGDDHGHIHTGRSHNHDDHSHVDGLRLKINLLKQAAIELRNSFIENNKEKEN